MIFSKYFVLFAPGLLALLQSTLARPWSVVFFALSCIANLQTSPLFDDGLIERETSEDTLFKREFTDIDARNNLLGWFPELERRGGRAHARTANQQQKRQKKKEQPKYTLGKDARAELDRMNLHGKVRKNTIKWHKKQVKKQMKTNPTLKGAHDAVIQ